MKFVTGESAIKYKGYVIVSDIHIGFEEYLEEKGYTIPDQTDNVIDRMKELSKKAEKLIILGDVKHSVFLKKRDKLLIFLSKISSIFSKIIIIKGNHDGGIEKYAGGFSNISVVSEYLLGDVLLIHGHKYATKEAIKKANKLLIGHFHSAHRIKDHLGLVDNKKSWVIYAFDNTSYINKMKVKTSIKKVVGFPCFNAFFDGTGETNGPYAKYLIKKEVLTLDLIKLV